MHKQKQDHIKQNPCDSEDKYKKEQFFNRWRQRI